MLKLKNYWLRWFVACFVIGTVSIQVACVGWMLYSMLQTPGGMILNPLIEISDPRSGKVLLTGFWAWIASQIYLGICAGIVGLILAFLARFFVGSKG